MSSGYRRVHPPWLVDRLRGGGPCRLRYGWLRAKRRARNWFTIMVNTTANIRLTGSQVPLMPASRPQGHGGAILGSEGLTNELAAPVSGLSVPAGSSSDKRNTGFRDAGPCDMKRASQPNSFSSMSAIAPSRTASQQRAEADRRQRPASGWMARLMLAVCSTLALAACGSLSQGGGADYTNSDAISSGAGRAGSSSPAAERVVDGVAELALSNRLVDDFDAARAAPVGTVTDGQPLYLYIRSTRPLGEIAHPADPYGKNAFSGYPHLFVQIGDNLSLRIINTCYVTLTPAEAKATELIVPLAPLTNRVGDLPSDCWLETVSNADPVRQTLEVRLAGFPGKFESWLPVPDLLGVVPVDTDLTQGSKAYGSMLKTKPGKAPAVPAAGREGAARRGAAADGARQSGAAAASGALAERRAASDAAADQAAADKAAEDRAAVEQQAARKAAEARAQAERAAAEKQEAERLAARRATEQAAADKAAADAEQARKAAQDRLATREAERTGGNAAAAAAGAGVAAGAAAVSGAAGAGAAVSSSGNAIVSSARPQNGARGAANAQQGRDQTAQALAEDPQLRATRRAAEQARIQQQQRLLAALPAGARLTAVTPLRPAARQSVGTQRMAQQLQSLTTTLLGREPSETYFIDRRWQTLRDPQSRQRSRQSIHAIAVFRGEECSWQSLLVTRRPGSGTLSEVQANGDEVPITCPELDARR